MQQKEKHVLQGVLHCLGTQMGCTNITQKRRNEQKKEIGVIILITVMFDNFKPLLMLSFRKLEKYITV